MVFSMELPNKKCNRNVNSKHKPHLKYFTWPAFLRQMAIGCLKCTWKNHICTIDIRFMQYDDDGERCLN